MGGNAGFDGPASAFRWMGRSVGGTRRGGASRPWDIIAEARDIRRGSSCFHTSSGKSSSPGIIIIVLQKLSVLVLGDIVHVPMRHHGAPLVFAFVGVIFIATELKAAPPSGY